MPGTETEVAASEDTTSSLPDPPVETSAAADSGTPAPDPTLAPAQTAAKAEPPKTDPEPVKLEDLLSDPAIARRLKQMEAKAVEAAVAKERDTAKKAAEREKMEESERLRAEKAEIQAERDAAKQQAEILTLRSDFNEAFLKESVSLQDPRSLEYIRDLATKKHQADSIAMDACVKEVLTEHSYLIKPPEAPAAAPPATTAVETKHNEAPADPAPKKQVDTRGMSPKEYKEYRRQTHGF